jgi:hypothetical protein
MAIAETVAAAAITTGVGMILNKIMPKKVNDGGSTASVRSPTSARQVVYGECRVGSTVTFVHLSRIYDYPNEFLCLVHTIAGHQIQSLVETDFDGLPVSWEGWDSGKLMYRESGSRFARALWSDWKLGKPCEPAFPGLILRMSSTSDGDRSALWTAAHRQDGCASVAIMMAFDADVFPNGPPNMSWVIEGKLLYDPRGSEIQYSTNAALAILDFLTNAEYGMGADIATEINMASVIAAANVCSENVVLKAGGTEPRYTCNGRFGTDSDPADILKSLEDSIAGYVSFSQGQWYIVPGVWSDPVLTLTDDDMRAPMQFQTLRSKRELFNAVQGKFYCSTLKYNQVNFPPVVNPVPLCDDSGFPNANQTGEWASATAYAVNDCVIDAGPRETKGVWAPGTAYVVNDYVTDPVTTDVYVCILNHTASAAGANPPTVNGNEPGVGQLWTTYWVDCTDVYTDFRGGVYVCKLAHTASALNEPGLGANFLTYWTEAKEYIWKDLDLNFTTSSAMAQRIANINLQRIRYQTTGLLRCKLSALQLQPGDVFNLTHPRFGWTNKTFQVMQTDFVIDEQQDGPVLGIDLKVQEVAADIYAWDAEYQEQTQGDPSQPTLPDSEIPRNTPAAYARGLTWTIGSDGETAHIHLGWDYTGDNAIVLANQSNTKYTPSGDQDVIGLDPTTTYNCYPYFNPAADKFSCVLGTGDGVGAPPWMEIPPTDASASITNVSVSGSGPYIVTITSTLNPGIGGNNVSISGLAPAVLNGLQSVMSSGSSSFTFQLPNNPGTLTDTSGTASVSSSSTLRARIAAWQANGNIPLAVLPLSITTPTSGTAGGGGGGDGGCLRIGMKVKERTRGVIACETVQIGDYLWSEGDTWLKVLQVSRQKHDLWVSLEFNNGAALDVTTGHPFTLGDRTMKRAAHLCLEDYIPSPTGIAYPRSIVFSNLVSEKIPITVESPHTFYASMDGKNWVLTHNIGAITQ